MTSGYKRWDNDIQYNEDFVVVLSRRLSESFNVTVLAPIDKGSKKSESLDNIKIYRHKQGPFGLCGLAYGSGILPNIRKNKALLLLAPFYLIYQFLELSRAVKKENISVIHAHWLIPQGLIAALYKTCINRKVKVVATIHGSDYWGFQNLFGRALKRFVLRNIDELAVSSDEIRDGVKNLGYKKKIYVYPMGVDTSLFSPSSFAKLKLKKQLGIDGAMLLFVGYVVEAKGIRYLINSMPKILEHHKDAKLVVVGDGNLREEMISLAGKIGISSNVLFLGRKEHAELPKYYASADIFILPSFSEGFPLVVMESMSSGNACITSDLPVFKRLEKENVLVTTPIGNSKAISIKVIEILSNPARSAQMQKKAREYTTKNFDWKIVTENYKKLVRGVSS